MEPRLRAAVANTDERWFNYFARAGLPRVIDEVNFWRPVSQGQRFNVVDVGGPIFFRLKAPRRAIAGYGFFAGSSEMTVSMAWEIFGEKNGDPTYSSFIGRIAAYRQRFGRESNGIDSQRITCLVLRNAVFLPESDWLPWDEREEWPDNVVSFKGYDLVIGSGRVLSDLLIQEGSAPPPDLGSEFTPIGWDGRLLRETVEAVREGQGTFRVRLLSAYGSACAVTREHSLPVLEAAHIQPYLGPASNHVQNGVVLRTDLHRLYDQGYVTITPDLRFEVSTRLNDEFHNGKTYYSLAGARVFVPEQSHLRPSQAALRWHADNVFR